MEFWQFVRIVRQQWKLIIILLVVCVVFSFILNLTKVRLYESSALVQISFSTTNPIEGTPDYETKATLFGTIQEAATSDLALRTIADKNGLDSSNVKALRQTIKVLPVNKSEFLKVTVIATSSKQAIDAANDLAAYIREASNKRWLDQLNKIVGYSENQLKIAQDSYAQANQAYDDAHTKYAELEAKSQQSDSEQRAKQIADANNAMLAAQDDYTKANSAIPKDTAAIDLAKGKLDRAQRDLDSLQQAALGPTDPTKQAQRIAELSQASGLEDALNRQKYAKGKVDELLAQIDQAKTLLNFPDLHAASVTIVDQAKTADDQGSGLTLFLGAAVVVALGLGVILAILINYLDRGIYSVGAARELYKQPVLAGIPVFQPYDLPSTVLLKKLKLDKILPSKNKPNVPKKGAAKKDKAKEDTPKKAKKDTPKAKEDTPKKDKAKKAGATPELVESGVLPEYAMESFRMLANGIVERHRHELPTLSAAPSPIRTALIQEAEAERIETLENPELPNKTNGHSTSNLALAQLPKVSGLTVDPGGTLSPIRPLGLLVTANGSGVGKTTMVSNLGTALAEAGFRTLLVDCDRKNPALLSSFGLDNPDDKGEAEPPPDEPGRIYNTEYPELDLLPYSSLPTQASGVIRPLDLSNLLQKVEANYQLLICDTPALSEASDAMSLIQHFPNILFVIDGRQPKVGPDQEKLHSLTMGNALLEGLVVNWMQIA